MKGIHIPKHSQTFLEMKKPCCRFQAIAILSDQIFKNISDMSNFYDSVNNSPAPQNSGRFKVNKTARSPARRVSL